MLLSMKREATVFLQDWYQNVGSKPLIIRGARQVGKSTLVRMFCKEFDLELIEFNFEIESLKSIDTDEFELNSLLDEIQLKKRKVIGPNSLLFFDEIQESPKLLKILRYFYEEVPNIKVIAAGSLLEIALKSENFSFPVGRVQFYHLGPMSFQEFLWATNQNFLDQKLSNFDFSEEIHSASLKALKEYFYIGGMPEVVKEFSITKSLARIRELQSQIIQTYQADFPKYNKRINLQRIARIFSSLSNNLGDKLIYSKLDQESKSRDIKRVIELLIDSRVILPCFHTSGNSTPLNASVDERLFKTYFLDIGLLGAMLNITKDSLDYEFKQNFSIKGLLAEQFVAQNINQFHGETRPPALYYHLRDKGSQKAEIDFLIEIENKIYPIEVKSSATGHLKSLKYFCSKDHVEAGIKVSLARYSIEDNFCSDKRLFSIPLYAIGHLKFQKNPFI